MFDKNSSYQIPWASFVKKQYLNTTLPSPELSKSSPDYTRPKTMAPANRPPIRPTTLAFDVPEITEFERTTSRLSNEQNMSSKLVKFLPKCKQCPKALNTCVES